jgi:dsDNA-binding SOS-regulon protein
MAVDFSKSEDRKNYLIEKLDDLLLGINVNYGSHLMEELASRLQKTVDEFKEELQDLIGSLKTSNEKKEELLTKIISGEADSPKTSEPEKVEEESEISEWEKRLEGLN